ncbi:MAG: hypothetical protein P9L88_07620 [Candidatus Tantalella remota]|nr:hypothetical protein [Candidatus Tantalella remota]
MDAMGKRGRGYAAYNESLAKCADFFERRSSLNVVLEETPDVFPEGSAPDAVFYCGWYSLAKYVPAFTWKKGSVGYHLASVEARSLRLCGEPYINAFPLPSEFFYFLSGGKYTLVEAYYKSLPFLSWKMVLIGDPLYKPPVRLRKGPFESLLRAEGF